jgi:hypothetical protein
MISCSENMNLTVLDKETMDSPENSISMHTPEDIAALHQEAVQKLNTE